MKTTSNIFSRLSKYEPTADVRPIENFTTEILAHLLEVSDSFRGRLLDYIGCENAALSDNLTVETQTTWDRVRPDISIYDEEQKRVFILIENKVDCPLNDNQIRQYLDLFDSRSQIDSRMLLTITKNRQRFEHSRYKNCTWSEVYDLVQTQLSETERSTSEYFLLQQFNEFLTLEGISMPCESIEWEYHPDLNNACLFVWKCLRNRIKTKGHIKFMANIDFYGIEGPIGEIKSKSKLFVGFYFRKKDSKNQIVFEFDGNEFKVESNSKCPRHILFGLSKLKGKSKKDQEDIFAKYFDEELIPECVKAYGGDYPMFQKVIEFLERKSISPQISFEGTPEDCTIGFYLNSEQWFGIHVKGSASRYAFWKLDNREWKPILESEKFEDTSRLAEQLIPQTV